MRLIDADALKDNFKNVDANGINLELDRYALKCIYDAPTVVELVMCKNCKWLDTHDHRCKVWNHGISEEDWCSCGERKEDVIK